LATETQEFTLDHLYELIESGDMNIDAFISSFDVQSRLAIYGSMAQAYVWEGQRMTDQQLTLLVAGVAYDNEAHELIGLLAETQQLGANDNILLFHPEIIDRGIQAHGDIDRVMSTVSDNINDYWTGGWDWLVGGRGDFFYVPNEPERGLADSYLDEVFGPLRVRSGEGEPQVRMMPGQQAAIDAQTSPFVHRPEGGWVEVQGGPFIMFGGAGMRAGLGAVSGTQGVRLGLNPTGPLANLVTQAGQKIPLFRAGSSSNTLIRSVFGKTAEQQAIKDGLRLMQSNNPTWGQTLQAAVVRAPGQTREAFKPIFLWSSGAFTASALNEWVWGPGNDARAQAQIESGDKFATPQVPNSPLTATVDAARNIEPVDASAVIAAFRESSGQQNASDVNTADPSQPPPLASEAGLANEDNPLLGVLPGDEIDTTRYLDEDGNPTGASGPPTTLTDTFNLTAGIHDPLTNKRWYHASDVREVLNSMNAWQRSALFDDLVTAGFVEDINGPLAFSPLQWGTLEEGFAALLAVSNKEGENYEDMLPRLVSLGELTETTPTPFLRQPYLPLDPVAMNQFIDESIETRLGRKANDWEKAILAKHREGLRAEQHQRTQDLLYDEHLARGRMAESETGGAFEVETEVEDFNADARFNSFFEERYAGELESEERRNQVHNDQTQLFNSMRRITGGM
jgi:hypothetical protein